MFKITRNLLMVLIIISTLSFTGCNPKQNTGKGSDNSKMAPVDLVWYAPTINELKDTQPVVDKVNEIVKPLINANVKINFLPFSSYNDKMKLLFASGDNFDICFTAPWCNDYYTNVSKDAFYPLDDLFDKYAPKTKAAIPQVYWDALKVKGKTYGVINYQIMYMQFGMSLQTQYTDKYKFNTDNIKKLEDLEPYYDQLVANEKGLIPISSSKMGIYDALYEGYEELSTGVGAIYLNDPTATVFNQYTSPEYKKHIELMRKWYLKGYFKPDIATITDVTADMKAKKAATTFFATAKPGVEGEVSLSMSGAPVKIVKLGPAYAQAGTALSTMTAINRSSKNPERAMMFIEQINTNKELFNLLSFGIEGKHYTLKDEIATPIPNSGYFPRSAWAYGNQFNAYYMEGQTPGVWDETIKMNEQSKKSILMGFTFDLSSVKSNLAQIQSIRDEYLPLLQTGTVDPAEKLPEFINKLKLAGSDKVIAELQKQISEFMASKK